MNKKIIKLLISILLILAVGISIFAGKNNEETPILIKIGESYEK